MVLVSHKHQFVFIKPRKVAGTSVESLLERYCLQTSRNQRESTDTIISEAGIVGNRLGKSKDGWYNHMSASEIRAKLGPSQFDKYRKITIVRNPWETAVSLYYYHCIGPKSPKHFRSWIRGIASRTNDSQWSISGKGVCDFYIRYEHLHDDLRQTLASLGLDPNIVQELSHWKNSNRNRDYRTFYDASTREFIKDRHALEIQMFDYQF